MTVLIFEKKPRPEINADNFDLSKRDKEVLRVIHEAELRIKYWERKLNTEFPLVLDEVSKLSFEQVTTELLDSDSGYWLNYPRRFKALIHSWKTKRSRLK